MKHIQLKSWEDCLHELNVAPVPKELSLVIEWTPIPISLECLDKLIMHTLEDSGAQDGAAAPFPAKSLAFYPCLLASGSFD